jgi:hypothetical protein
MYVFAYPYPARFVYAFTLRRQREINAIKRKIEEETPLTLEESRVLRAEYVQLERKHQEIVDRLSTEISRLNTALDETQKTALARPELEPAERLYGALEPTQLALLQQLEKHGGEAAEKVLVKSSTEPKIKTEFDLGELERRKLIKKDFDQRNMEYMYEFTHEGRRVLLNEGKFGA